MNDPCKQCLVSPICRIPCIEYEEYIQESIQESTKNVYQGSISRVSTHLKRYRPKQYYIYLSRLDGAETELYTLIMNRATIMKIKPGFV